MVYSLLILMAGLLTFCNVTEAAPTFNRPYLTWQGDPCQSMTINYQTAAVPPAVKAWYDTKSHQGIRAQYAFSAAGAGHQIPGLADARSINSIALTGLKPGTRYYFTFGDDAAKESSEFFFETPPNNGRPIRFVIGGDMGATPLAEALVRQAGKQNPMFGVVGGDIAYENGALEEVADCDAWLGQWMDGMVAPDGRLIPMVLAMGNHEVNKKEGPEEVRAPFFYGFYPQGGKSFFSRTFGPNLALLMLDSGHIVSHESQVDWLRLQLNGFFGIKNVIPLYHVPFYPSHRPFDGAPSVAGRQFWMPLFDEYKIRVSFEHHDHTFKRTKPLRGNAVDPEGTVYLGDGCFGVPPREIDNADAWYLEKASSTGHFWVVDASAKGVVCNAIDKDGNTFDTWSSQK